MHPFGGGGLVAARPVFVASFLVALHRRVRVRRKYLARSHKLLLYGHGSSPIGPSPNRTIVFRSGTASFTSSPDELVGKCSPPCPRRSSGLTVRRLFFVKRCPPPFPDPHRLETASRIRGGGPVSLVAPFPISIWLYLLAFRARWWWRPHAAPISI